MATFSPQRGPPTREIKVLGSSIACEARICVLWPFLILLGFVGAFLSLVAFKRDLGLLLAAQGLIFVIFFPFVVDD
jgi:hypothetical protein